MNTLATHLIQILSDGQFHSGQEIGAQFNVTRGAIWKAVKRLQTYGLDVYSVPGRGYCLSNKIELLNKQSIEHALTFPTKQAIQSLDVFMTTASTSEYLLKNISRFFDLSQICIAEMQTAGRGRQGRQWYAPFGCNVNLSFTWRFKQGIAGLSGLSLAVAVVVAKVLKAFSVSDLALKWPNDILCQGKKLAGILLDIEGNLEGPCTVVVGIGINVDFSGAAEVLIDQPWIDLNSVLTQVPSRNQLIAHLLNELFVMASDYQSNGFSGYRTHWQNLDYLYNKPIIVKRPGSELTGIAKGIDAQGYLILNADDQQCLIHSGEVSVRTV